jgi:hypothetical protein
MRKTVGMILVIAAALAAAVAFSQTSDGNSLANGPRSPGPHGPFSASDFDRNGEVTRAEIDRFIEMGPEREFGMVAYFAQFDTNNDQILDEGEIVDVEPAFAFDGSDADADGILTLEEVTQYANERLYRQMGLGEFFDLIDTNGDDLVSAEEIEAAHVSGQLPRG